LLRVTSSNAVIDLRSLLDAVTFNWLIGNNDAHAKNYSFLYGRDGMRRLAPLYDLVCTVYYPEIDNRLAMKIGGQANPDLVFPEEFQVFATEAGLGPALVKQRIPGLAQDVLESIKTIEAADETSEKIAALITKRCERVISSFKSS
jgi:serine/threonine-protein kinase HipA